LPSQLFRKECCDLSLVISYSGSVYGEIQATVHLSGMPDMLLTFAKYVPPGDCGVDYSCVE
jgi:hypothetical protein